MLNENLPESDNAQYTEVLEDYGNLLIKLRNVAQERGVEGFRTVQIELDDGENASKAEIEETMLHAFKNFPVILEGFRESLSRMPGNSIRENLESLDQLKRTLVGLQEFFGDLQEKLKTDNVELISAISEADSGTQELINRTTGIIDLEEEILARCRG